MTIVGVGSLFEITLAVLNHFPLFAVMLRFKDPLRLPSCIYFEVCEASYILGWFDRTPKPSGSLTYMHLKSNPIGFGPIFYQYAYIFKQVAASYLSTTSFNRFLTGQPIRFMEKLNVTCGT